MRTILFISTLFLFIGCGSESNTKPAPTKEPIINSGDRPISPITTNKEETPPSIPSL